MKMKEKKVSGRFKKGKGVRESKDTGKEIKERVGWGGLEYRA